MLSPPPLAREPDAPTEAPIHLGAYKLIKLLGSGGMGVVYVAEDTQLGRKAAVKVMKSEVTIVDARSYERFLREARAVAAIRHQNVVTVYQVGEEQGIPYLAMELLRGSSLSAYLDKNPTPAIGSAIRVAREVAEGLAAAHAKGLIHRDIKPGNIFLEAPNGRVKLLDFGLARAASTEPDATDKLTCTGLVVGTPSFMSPEQARGEALDGRSDLFSLGAVLYLLCTGREPFAGTTPTAILTALAVDRQQPAREVNPKVPDALSDLIDRLLAKKPADRPATAKEVVQSLRQIERGMTDAITAPVTAPVHAVDIAPFTMAVAEPERKTDGPKPAPSTKTRRPRKRVKRKRRSAAWIAVVAACFVPVILGAGYLIAHDDRPAKTKTADTKAPEAKSTTTTVTTTPAAEVKTNTPPGFPLPKMGPPPPPGGPGFGPGSPGFGPPPRGGPGSPGFGPPKD
ncbi:MAG TPA: serine/threonine-protein kinase [Gemmataceae bacterium]|jgi:serine/threonine protein kinase|nr:serine/threonine-protein kinase [Gemmataceae bacterium]